MLTVPPRPALCLWTACVALLLAGCADAGDPAPPRPTERAAAEPAPAPAPQTRPGVSLDQLLAIHDDEAAFLQTLRPPRSERAEPVENEYIAGQMDTVRTRVYDGLRVRAYEVTDGPVFIQSVTVTGGGYGTSGGVAVGETRAALEAVLGPPATGPDAGRGGAVVYQTGSGPAPTTVEVTYEPDAGGTERASEITWRPYLD